MRTLTHFLSNVGRDTERMFKEIDMIRKKQIELANEHIGLEAIDEISQVFYFYFQVNTNRMIDHLFYKLRAILRMTIGEI